MDPTRQIARTLLYEGYLLWPYRRSALKNQQRWTFGGVYPRGYSVARGEDDPWRIRTQCLLMAEPAATVDISVRFLHVVRRDLARCRGDDLEPVPELTVAGLRHLAWEEADEREVTAAGLEIGRLLRVPHRSEVDVPAGEETAWLVGHCGRREGAVVRHWEALWGQVRVAAERLPATAGADPVPGAGPDPAPGTGPDRAPGNGPVPAPGAELVRLTVDVENLTPWLGRERPEALRRTLVSTHTVAHARRGEFVSLLEPPPSLSQAAAACHNHGTWPVLVGKPGERHTILSSPIILYDYPQVAPESPGDLFDATEIDKLLTLSVLSLTDAEREEARATDPRVRELIDRCAALGPEQLDRLHGALREVHHAAE